jgi:DNA-binding PadR family transcriptional regulator
MPDSDVVAPNLTKSCNEVLILTVLAGGSKHGYQLAVEIEDRSSGFFRFNHGTLYPILHKLEREGMIRGSWSGDELRRKRKSYALTRKGRRYLDGQVEAWNRFFGCFTDIVEGFRR